MKREIGARLLVLELDGVREKHGADITGVRTRDGDDGSARQLFENPSRLERRQAAQKRRRRRRRIGSHLDVAGPTPRY